MRNWIISIKYLYRECMVYNLVFTLIAADLLIRFGVNSFTSIFWIKVIGYVFTAIVYYWNRKQYLYFFHNLNQNRRNLIISAVSSDLLITIILFSTLKILID